MLPPPARSCRRFHRQAVRWSRSTWKSRIRSVAGSSPSPSARSSPRLGVMPMPAVTRAVVPPKTRERSEEHTSELQSRGHLVCRLLLEKKKTKTDRQQDDKTRKTEDQQKHTHDS